jgi:arylsulfatase A
VIQGAFAVLSIALAHGLSAASNSPPNVLLILADDLGYGDVDALNSKSKISTPNIDELARQGITFTDAHSAAVCIPSRYELLTGRYLFRSHRVFNSQALIEPGRVTLASVLKSAGYATAMIGKWHLSFEGGTAFDYSQPLRGGPVDHGFDSYFGIPASPDEPPYFYIENDRAVEAPTAAVGTHSSADFRFIQGEFWEGGPIAPRFRHDQVLTKLAHRAVAFIRARAAVSQPFFLFFSMTAPHTPGLPERSYRGRSGAGAYGDFIMELDDVVGRVLATLKEVGKTDNTIVIFTSDNGPHWYEADARKYGHQAAGPWRGMKADAWDGGHRVPFIVRWPGKIAAGTSSTQLISFTDLLATLASVTDQELPPGAGEDSLSILSALLGRPSRPLRTTIVHETISLDGQLLAIRHKNWKLIPSACAVSLFEGFSDDATLSDPCKRSRGLGTPAGQLFDLAADPQEKRNVYSERPEIVRELTRALDHVRAHGQRFQTN